MLNLDSGLKTYNTNRARYTMSDSKLEKIAKILIKELEQLRDDIKDFDFPEDLLEVVTEVVASVEYYSNVTEKLDGKEKKKLAIILINILVDVPGLPEFVEEKIIEMIVEWTVSIFNKYFGSDWVGQVKGE